MCRHDGQGAVYNYSAFVGEADSGGGYWSGSGETPQAAIEAVRKKVREELKNVLEFATAIENV